MGKEIIFYYDVVCPFAYMASRYIEQLGQKTGADIHWRPVLLGGLYEATKAAQGKSGSATDVMSPSRLKMSVIDLHRQMHRLGIPYNEPINHPQKTVNAMRLLAAIADHSLRVLVSHALYKAYWFEGSDVSEDSVLERVAAQFGLSSYKLLSSDTASKKLRSNTAEAAHRGAFGVPGMEELLRSVAPISLSVEWVPVLVGALFKKIGTPVVPLFAMSEAKRQYMVRDLHDWCEYCGAEFKWPDAFPIRSVLPLRLTLAANSQPALIKAIFAAAWRDNKDIGKREVLSEVVSGVDKEKAGLWLKEAESEHVKAQLFANTSRAVDDGVCGVPSFQVNSSSEVVWGQDRMNVVADYLCGWKHAKL